LRFTLGGLVPWQGWDKNPQVEDYTQLVDINAGVYVNPESWPIDHYLPIHTGDTLLSTQMDWETLRLNLIDTDKGDHPYLIQMSTVQAGNDVYQVGKRLFDPLNLRLSAGGPTPLTGTMRDLAKDGRFQFRWKRSAFTACQVAVHPATDQTAPRQSFSLEALPGFAEHNSPGVSMDLLYWRFPTGAADFDLGEVALANPPLGFERRLNAAFTFFKTSTLPDGDKVMAGGDIRVVTNALPTAERMLEPVVTPVLEPMVDGRSWFDDQAISTLTPRLSWIPPAVGSPSGYTVFISRLDKGTYGWASGALVGRIYTKECGVHVPSGILQPGCRYLLKITAYQMPWDPSAAPWLSRGGANGQADCISGILTLTQ